MPDSNDKEHEKQPETKLRGPAAPFQSLAIRTGGIPIRHRDSLHSHFFQRPPMTLRIVTGVGRYQMRRGPQQGVLVPARLLSTTRGRWAARQTHLLSSRF